jgi:hypothetical protein
MTTKKQVNTQIIDKRPVILKLNRIVNIHELSIKDTMTNSLLPNSNNNIGFGPLSGSEPVYNPAKWNTRPKIKQSHNCYAYVLNKIAPRLKGKPQPGYFAGYDQLQFADYNCQTFLKRLKKDNPLLYKTTFKRPCKKGFHKGFIALDRKQDSDYHFYRQDKSGMWSHKPGATDVTDLDASDMKITKPHKANRKYKFYNYNTPCFYFCVNSKLTRAHSKHN